MVDGQSRNYRLVVPTTVTPGTPAPLVFAFHGLFDSKHLMPLYTFLDLLAHEKRFIIVYPSGAGSAWPLLPEWAVNDLGLYDAIYREVTSQYNVDLNRVYLTGMSMGAYFIHMIASQRSDQIAAIASHSGSLGYLQFKPLNVTRKYAVLAIHGSADQLIPAEESKKMQRLYTTWGHPTSYVEAAGVGHAWAHTIGINQKIWAFFEQNPRR